MDGEVTADMLATETDDEREGDGLITQAYSALLTAFLVEGQPALRADVVYVLPEGGLNALASVRKRLTLMQVWDRDCDSFYWFCLTAALFRSPFQP